MNLQQVKGILTGNPGKLHCPENAELIRKCAAAMDDLLKR